MQNTDSYNWWCQVRNNHGNPPGTVNVAAKTIIATYICPSDVLPRQDNNGYGKSNYCCCLGGDSPWYLQLTQGLDGQGPGTNWSQPSGSSRQNGMFRLAQTNSFHFVTSFADLTDGSSNVIAIGEVSESGNVQRTIIDRVFPLWAGGNNDWAGQWRISSWARVAGQFTPINSKDTTPIANNLSLSDFSFGSKHPGGANFLLGDGSVRFLSETIDAILYERLAAINDGNPVQMP